MPGGKHITLSLADKVRLIEKHEKEKRSAKELTVEFKVGKTHVYDTLKNKNKIMDEWLNGTAGQSKRLSKSTPNEEINSVVWEWFVGVRAKGLPLSGTLIQTEALEVAKKLGKFDFKASNGWLDSFKSRHNLVFNEICGEANDVDNQSVSEWKEKIPKLIEGYETKDIFNGDETGLFFRMLPTKSLVEKGDKCVGGKMSKERLTVFFCASMEGEIEKPLVIGKAACPRPFRHLDRNSLPVHWRFNKKAWMTGAIMEEWLNMFNEKMKIQNRKVLLFLDNATCHPHLSLTNVKLAWFPPNTTSITQPLDQGVISNFKCFYRKFVLQSLIVKLKDVSTVSELCKSINVLDAVCWINQAIKKVIPQTVKKCFVKAGFPSQETTEVDIPNNETECEGEIAVLCQEAHLQFEPDDVVHFDDDLYVCENVSHAVDLLEDTEAQEDDDDNGRDEEDVRELKIKTFNEALSAVNDLHEFAAFKNCPKLIELMQDAKEVIFNSSLKSTRQMTMKDYFRKQQM